jgi:hypothetical protein
MARIKREMILSFNFMNIHAALGMDYLTLTNISLLKWKK